MSVSVLTACMLLGWASCGEEELPPLVLPDDAAVPVCGDAGYPAFRCCDDGGRGGPVCRDGTWTCRDGERTC